MNQPIDTAVPSLSEVTDAYRKWRAQRTHRHSTPLALRQQAVALLERHTRAEIITTLGISGTAFKQWMLDLRGDESAPPVRTRGPAKHYATADFVELPSLTPTPTPASVSTPAPDLIVDLPDGTRLTARGSLCTEQLLSSLGRMRGVA